MLNKFIFDCFDGKMEKRNWSLCVCNYYGILVLNTNNINYFIF